MKNFKTLICLFFIIGSSCKKLVEVPAPYTSTNEEFAYMYDFNAPAVLNGIYSTMINENRFLNAGAGWGKFTGLLSDELSFSLSIANNQALFPFYTNSLHPVNNVPGDWTANYKKIYVTNAAIAGLTKSTSLSNNIRTQLLGEAYFLRAFFYFDLVNKYGDVPLAISTDFQENSHLSRSSISIVYNQIIADLQQAINLLSSKYYNGMINGETTDRVRPTKAVALALLARVYLYNRNYSSAESTATLVIQSPGIQLENNLDDVFIKTSREAIWQLMPTGVSPSNNANTGEGNVYILSPIGLGKGVIYTHDIYLSSALIDSIENNDLRKTKWIRYANGYPYAFKYKIGADIAPNSVTKEYVMMFRLAEQYLIRAEARIQMGKISEGITDLNLLRNRATDQTAPIKLPQLPSTLTKMAALQKVEHERQVELFTEGHRWFDLNRSEGFLNPSKSRADELLGLIKGANWQITDKLFPIPDNEIQKSPALIGNQNPGYN